MDGLILLIAMIVLFVLDALANRYGCDSRRAFARIDTYTYSHIH